jgi:hypothetical protein
MAGSTKTVDTDCPTLPLYCCSTNIVARGKTVPCISEPSIIVAIFSAAIFCRNRLGA